MRANVGLRERRLRRGWTLDDVADQLQREASRLGLPAPAADRQTVGRWERGERKPWPLAVRLLCQVYEATPAELGLTRDRDDGPSELLRLVQGSDVTAGTVADTEAAVLRLRRAYARTPTEDLIADLRARLTATQRLLRGRLTSPQRRDLTASAGWLALLLATGWFDAEKRETAWSWQRAALEIAQDLGHGELEGWAWETAAYACLSAGAYRDSVQHAERGLGRAQGSAAVALRLQVARASARMGGKDQTMAALREAGVVLERLPEPEFLDDHYSFDPGKFGFYAATATVLVGLPSEAERYAREVITTQGDPGGANYWPRRVSVARADLAHALAQRGEIDEAAHEAWLALDGPLAHATTRKRVGELLRALQDFSDVAEVRALRERVGA